MITLAEKLLLFKHEQEINVSNGAVEFVSSTAMTITPKYTNAGVTLQYSLDNISWTNIKSGTTTPSANTIYFRGSAAGTKSLYNSSSTSNAWVFTGSTNLECNGKLDRLLQDTLGDDNDILTINDFCFCYMFNNVNTLIKAPELPATILSMYCYYCMFQGCTLLKTTPTLPATILAINCYQSMFRSCISLTTVPILSATTLPNYCYRLMFYGCTGIKLSTTMTEIYDTAYRIPTAGTGTVGSYSLTDMFTSTGGTFKTTPTIYKTYYTENTPV